MAVTRAIVNAKGIAGLYSGFRPFLIQMMAKSSVRFFGFEFLGARHFYLFILTEYFASLSMNIIILYFLHTADCVDRYGLGDRKANPGFWTLVCGLGAGTVESLALTAPTDRVKVLGQALSAERGGIAPTATQLVRERGFMTLYTGIVLFVRSHD